MGDLIVGGDSKPIYINEHLTSYFQLLFKKARDMRRSGVLRYVWISGGRLFVKKEGDVEATVIQHPHDLERFM